jgi:hypothetical protein
MAFENSHELVNIIPFELQISNLGKTLGGWAHKLRAERNEKPSDIKGVIHRYSLLE